MADKFEEVKKLVEQISKLNKDEQTFVLFNLAGRMAGEMKVGTFAAEARRKNEKAIVVYSVDALVVDEIVKVVNDPKMTVRLKTDTVNLPSGSIEVQEGMEPSPDSLPAFGKNPTPKEPN